MGNNFNKNTLWQKIVWKDVKVLKVSKEHLDRLFYKTSYEEQDFGEIIVMNKTRNAKRKKWRFRVKQTLHWTTRNFKDKKKDLIHLCENKLIPEN